MSSVTLNDVAVTGTERERGFFARLGERLIAARKAEADRAVAAYLLSLDDKTLANLGYNRTELEARDPRGYPFL